MEYFTLLRILYRDLLGVFSATFPFDYIRSVSRFLNKFYKERNWNVYITLSY